MHFDYRDYFGRESRTGYETLLYDAMIGDSSLFKRADMIERGWSIIQPILDAWQNSLQSIGAAISSNPRIVLLTPGPHNSAYPEHVLLATPEAMSDVSHPEEAEAFRRSCRRRAEPTIVACSIGSGRAQLGWAHRILDRLEPTITWAVVDASVKAEDVGHRISLLGGVDVIAITGIADTISPAAILGLGIPIGRIGSNPATPAVWADLLTDRLER